MASIKALAAIAITLIVACPIGLGYLFAFDEEETEVWQVSENVNISDLMLNNSNPYYQEYRGTSNNSQVYQENTITGQTWTVPTYRSVQDSPVTSYPVDVSGVTKYADVSQGWWAGGSSSSGPAAHWYNSQENISARLIVWFNGSSNHHLTMVPSHSEIGNTARYTNPFHISQVDGIVSIQIYSYDSILSHPTPEIGPEIIQEYTLGQYDVMMIEINSDHSLKFSGLASVPAMGSYPATYHSISWGAPEEFSADPASAPSDFNWIVLGTDSGITLRVDLTVSQAGSYPATADYTLDPSAIFPDESWKIKFNSIGVYGYSFSFADNDYVVHNGKITVNGKEISLKGAVIESLYNSRAGQYDYAINGISLGSGADPATAFFGGVWSITATASIMESVSSTEMKWQAGQFGFDKDSLVAVGLLMAGAAFVVLGMTGRMSGSKVGILALICGGASIVYLLLL